LKRKVGYGEINEINEIIEEEQIRNEKRNKMDIDTVSTSGPQTSALETVVSAIV
jgi:hypothetical protein